MNGLNLGSDQRLPLYQRLRDEMLAKISSGQWRPGEPIPTEAELTKIYSVAIGTVRKAVDTLVADGLLQRNQGRGTYVRRPDFNASLFRFFRQVSSSGEQQVPQSRIISLNLEQAPEAVTHALNLNRADAAICMQRIRMGNERAIFSEEIWLPAPRFAKLLDLSLNEFGNLLYPFYEEQCGQLIASAKETLTVEPADAQTSAALGIDAGKPVVVIERIALSYDSTPLEYRISRGAADTFRYQIEIS
ncbi:GntR family transcriptional regulator [Pseudomonas sp. NPDC078700]|uniref:GntR family transcriptional regulator n=1 Tax=Pseudomonas sp. NPDC078700 TaxID=3364424 RepID=UPI0037CAE0F8